MTLASIAASHNSISYAW